MRRSGSRAGLPEGGVVGLWLLLRLLSWLWMAVASTIRPSTAREAAIALWPPSAPLFPWVERALLAPWERRDVVYYLAIASRGYRVDDGTAQFHPLFPWLAQPLAWLTGQPLLALLLVSSLASLLLVVVFERLARLDLGPEAARTSVLLLLFWPVAFVLFIPYPEGLFLAWAVLCLFWSRRQRWWLAGLAGGLAALTRQQGIFLLLPMAWELWEARDRRAGRSWLSLGLIPAGLLAWIVYRGVVLGDLGPDAAEGESLIFSLLISPSARQVVPIQAFLWPWQALGLALVKLWQAPEYNLLLDIILSGVFIALLGLAWPNLRPSYRLYVLAIVLISFSYHTGPLYPYMGLPRHLYLAFPVFIGLGPVANRRWQRLSLVGVGFLGVLFLLLQVAISGWVP